MTLYTYKTSMVKQFALGKMNFFKNLYMEKRIYFRPKSNTGKATLLEKFRLNLNKEPHLSLQCTFP